MKILLVNDDGIQSIGIQALAHELSLKHDIVVAAPAMEQSGMAHAITVHKRIEVETYPPLLEAGCMEAWRIHGTPADCVKIYLEAMSAQQKPDLVVSGINKGANLGTDVLYSGTVGGAIEGHLHGIPYIAVSLDIDSEISYENVARLFMQRLPMLLNEAKPVLLNINFPTKVKDNIPSFVYTKVGHRDYANAFKRIEENGRCFYMMGGEIYDGENSDITDIYAVQHGYIAITPLQLDLTDHTLLDIKLND